MIGLSNLLPRVRTETRSKSKLRSSAASILSRFSRETDGNMTIFGIAGIFIMMVYGGIGIDMIHSEVERARLQNTLDRAVLAAADLEQQIDPTLLVQDYLTKMNLEDTLANVDITVDAGLNYRTVTAEAQRTFNANFLKILGFDTLQATGIAAAEERISNIEISMILDISGSMGQNEKIENLRDAAVEFVETVINNDDAGLTTISIVPYNATVSLGPTVSQHYTLTDEHDNSTCPIFPDSAFTSRAVSPTEALQRLAHFDPYTLDVNTTVTPDSWCPTGTYGSVIAHSSDRDELVAHIGTLSAGGNTAIDLGMKWGVALLDPSARSVVTGLIASGDVVPEAAGRPADYDAPDALKIAVVMTDGMNTTQFNLAPEYASGASNIWIDDRGDNDPTNDRFSHRVRDESGTNNDVYFWSRYEYGSWNDRYDSDPDGGNSARRMDNSEVFARWGTRAFGQKFFRKPYYDGWVSYNQYYNAYYAYTPIVSGDEADDRLSTICSSARDADITVFAIGFEAPDEGQAAMRDCASSPAHYFPVEGLEISDAFQAIARTINQLRLTQ
ncbi:pilus assembly protein TadG-related protein [Marivita sp.]|jgi:Flp pilus assembly protein TadG|uniref:pilus assembly protein TadG-related protein n=3 Tax=Alphaproteobacteria TaxID=28211 RepID=UPI00321B4CA8